MLYTIHYALYSTPTTTTTTPTTLCTHRPQSSEIVMPMKVQEAEEEPFPTPITAAITPIAEPVKMEVAEVEAELEEDEDNILKLLEEEETYACIINYRAP
jgi:hypothetical protein